MYQKPTGARAGTSAKSNGAHSRRKGGQLQSARGPASRAALTVPGDGLKRKRTVRTAEVTIETEENVVLRGGLARCSTLMWCPVCRRQVQMVTPEQAARIAGVSTRRIYAWVEAQKVHFAETPEGLLTICLDSLSEAIVSGTRAARQSSR